jgi:hypothetical protein
LYALIENTKGGLYRSDDAGTGNWLMKIKIFGKDHGIMNLQADPKTKMV